MSDSISMHQATIGVTTRALRNLRHILGKGQAHAEAAGYAPSLLLQSRLAPDMFPLVRQVQIATDTAKNAAARLAGVEALRFEDEETTFEELFARIDRALGYLESFTAGQFEGSRDRAIVLPRGKNEPLHFEGHAYLLGFVMPNLQFHVTTAYAILRQAGVRLEKGDYLRGGG